MRRRSFLARCAAIAAGLFCAGRTPAVTPLPAADDVNRFIRDRRSEMSLVLVKRSAGPKAEGMTGWGEPCWLVEANGQPLREEYLYIATRSPGGHQDGLPVYVCSAPVESA